MQKPEIPENERGRLKELDFYQIKEIREEGDFDFLTSISAKFCETKISLISLITEDKQWFVSHHGIDLRETSRDFSFCAHAINTPEVPFVVEDARKDERFRDNPLVTNDLNIIFYAGVPLVNQHGYVLGTLCVIDDKPKKLNGEQLEFLQKLAKQATNLLELRKKELEFSQANNELKKSLKLLEETQVANNIGVWELDIATGHTTWTETVYHIHEVPLDFDHNKANGIEFYHPDYRSEILNSLHNAIEKNERFDINCLLITAKGNQKWVRCTGRKYGDKVIGSFQDITEIKRNELKFQGIFNSTYSFLGILNREGVLLESNDTSINTAGLKSGDVIGKYFWDCYWWQISDQTKEELKVNFQKALSGEAVVYEVDVWIADQTPVTILFSLKPLFDDFGNVIFVIPEGRPIQDIVDARQRYKAVIDGTNVGTWEWNVQTGETVFNERWAEIVGYTLEELEPVSIETWIKLAHPDTLQESEIRLNECFQKKVEFYEIEAKMKHKNGHWVWVYDRGKVFEWTEDGKPLWMYGTHQDITERKQYEEALQISEEAFRGNFENAAIGMALLDKNSKWLKVNKRFCDTLGYTESEMMNLTFQDITHPEDLNADLTLLKEMIEGERDHYQMEKRYLHKEGHVVYIIIAVSMVKNASGEILYFISQYLDITAIKHAEIQLNLLLAENRAIMDATTDVALISSDKSGIISSYNVGAMKMLGFKKEEVIGKRIHDTLLLTGEYVAAAKKLGSQGSGDFTDFEFFNGLATGMKPELREWTFKRNDGSLVSVLLSVSPIQTDKQIAGYLFAATDISYIKSIQIKLEQKNEEMEQFAYVAAHDLKTPLRGITTFLSLLEKKYSYELNDDAKSYIRKATLSAKRMGTLISDILDFSKTGIIGQDNINLDELMELIIANYSQDGNLKITKSLLPVIKGDASSLIQLFGNLINNAIKYQPEENIPEIKIEAKEDEKNWIISVADNGIGIDPEHQKKVFEIFKRLHTDSEYSGTGIGLATSKKIVSAYGGNIWYEPNIPNGTIFNISFPKSIIPNDKF